MRPGQREVGALVIELLTTEFDDVCVTPQVLRVTGPALHTRSASESSVEPARRSHVRCNILVTVETELRLACPIAPVVTVRALFFVLGMSSTELAGHQQRFRVHGFSTPCREQAE